MNYLYTLKEALEYSKQSNIESWVHLFLNHEGNNIPFSNGLKLERRYYIGPIKMPLSLFKRICGPEKEMPYQVDLIEFKETIMSIRERFQNGWEMPPLIINYEKGHFTLNDGNHRFEALIQEKIPNYYVIIWITKQDDYEQFLRNYKHFL